MEGLLRLQPAHFVFEVTRGEPSTLRVKFSNISQGRIAFRIRTRLPNQYCVTPPREILHVGETREVSITQAALRLPADLRTWFDKFQIFVVPIDTPELKMCTKDNVWDVARDNVVVKRKFEVRLRRAPDAENPPKKAVVQRQRCATTGARYIRVEPDEVRFRVTPGVQAMSILKITNGFRCPVAFKAKVSQLERYRISPNRYIIGPGHSKVVAVYLEPFEVKPEELHTVEDKMLFLFARMDDMERRTCSIDSIWGVVDQREYIHKRYFVKMELAGAEIEERENEDSNGHDMQQEHDVANAACVVPALTLPIGETVNADRAVGAPPLLCISPTPIASPMSASSMATAFTGPSRASSSRYSSPLPDVVPAFWNPKEQEAEQNEAEAAAEEAAVVTGRGVEDEDIVFVTSPNPGFISPPAPLQPSLAKQLAALKMMEDCGDS